MGDEMSAHSSEPYDGCMRAVSELEGAAADGMEGADWDEFRLNESIALACRRFRAEIAIAVKIFTDSARDGQT